MLVNVFDSVYKLNQFCLRLFLTKKKNVRKEYLVLSISGFACYQRELVAMAIGRV